MNDPISTGLTERQAEVLDLISHGLTYDQVASKLNINTGSVKGTLQRVYRKLGADSAAHAVRLGLESGELERGPEGGLRAQSDALKVELARVYRALAEANARAGSHSPTVPAHAFGEYLLGLVA